MFVGNMFGCLSASIQRRNGKTWDLLKTTCTLLRHCQTTTTWEASIRSWFEHYFTLRLSISTQRTIIYRCCAIYARKMCVCIMHWRDLNANHMHCSIFWCQRAGGYCIASELRLSFLTVEETKSNFQSIEHRHPQAGVSVVDTRDHEQSSVFSKSRYEAIHRGKCLQFHEMVLFCVS